MLDRLGWTAYSTRSSPADVDEGKPGPAPYLLAAEQLGVSASQCIAFEDTDAGVTSATAAG